MLINLQFMNAQYRPKKDSFCLFIWSVASLCVVSTKSYHHCDTVSYWCHHIHKPLTDDTIYNRYFMVTQQTWNQPNTQHDIPVRSF